MLQGELSAILLTFIKVPYFIKTFVLSIFKWSLKTGFTVFTYFQLQQLHDVGEEMAVLSVNTFEGTVAHFGTNHGEWFLSEQKNLKENFLKYCQSVSKSM